MNDEVEKYYLKQKSDKNRLKIKFDNIRRVRKDNFDLQRNYFMGMEMPPDKDV